jgi:phage tail-like protein
MGMLDDDFFVRFVSLFQELATTVLDGVDNIPNTVDVTVAPPPLVRWLGSWIGIDNIDSSLPVELQRRIVQESGKMLSWRGTHRGLVQFLELVTGGPVVVEDSGGVFVAGEAGYRAPHVRMQVASTGWIPEPDFLTVVIDELPANVTYELYVGDRRLWPPPVFEGAGSQLAGPVAIGASVDVDETAPFAARWTPPAADEGGVL